MKLGKKVDAQTWILEEAGCHGLIGQQLQA
jgi:hypothetical protein